MGVSKKSLSWTSTFVTMVLQENARRSDVTFVVQTFWTPPYSTVVKNVGGTSFSRKRLPRRRLPLTATSQESQARAYGSCLRQDANKKKRRRSSSSPSLSSLSSSLSCREKIFNSKPSNPQALQLYIFIEQKQQKDPSSNRGCRADQNSKQKRKV